MASKKKEAVAALKAELGRRKLLVVVDAQQFRLDVEPGGPSGPGGTPAGVMAVWVEHANDERVIALYANMPICIGKLAFGVETVGGWRVVRAGDWILTAGDGARYPVPAKFLQVCHLDDDGGSNGQ